MRDEPIIRVEGSDGQVTEAVPFKRQRKGWREAREEAARSGSADVGPGSGPMSDPGRPGRRTAECAFCTLGERPDRHLVVVAE